METVKYRIVKDFLVMQADSELQEVIALSQEIVAKRVASRPKERRKITTVEAFMRSGSQSRRRKADDDE